VAGLLHMSSTAKGLKVHSLGLQVLHVQDVVVWPIDIALQTHANCQFHLVASSLKGTASQRYERHVVLLHSARSSTATRGCNVAGMAS
jgi:hypothetical protein